MYDGHTSSARRRLIGMAALAVASGVGLSDVRAQRIYWRSGSSIYSSNLDGSQMGSFEVPVAGLNSGGDIAVDSLGRKLYWSESYQQGQIARANLDGSSPEIIVEGAQAESIVIDPLEGKIYWVVNYFADYQTRKIRRADLDGGNVEDVFDVLLDAIPRDLAVDSARRKICWVTDPPSSIQCGDLDTGMAEVVVDHGFEGLTDRMAIDSVGGRIHWTAITGGAPPDFLQSADFDGTEIQTDGVVFGRPLDVVVNDRDGKLIWILWRTNEDRTVGIRQSNLDGSGAEDILSHIPGGAHRLALDMAGIGLSFDIKLGACPNNVNPRSRGLVPVALAGTETFGVAEVDLDSVELRRADATGEAVAIAIRGQHLMAHMEDVTAPREDAGCDCQETHPDGLIDLVLHFSAEEMTDAFGLDALGPGESLELALTGQLLDGTYFRATDCVTIPGGKAKAQSDRGLRGRGER